MANFNSSILFALQNEDATLAYKTVPDEPPGAYAISGINSKSFPVEFNQINNITQIRRGPAVQSFYKTHFWNTYYDQLISDDLASRVLDAAINSGANTAVKLLQKAVNSISENKLVEDGKWGPATLNAVNKGDQSKLLSSFKKIRSDHYDAIVEKNPSLTKYLSAWKARASK